MSETEAVRDPLDVAADEAAQLMAEWKARGMPWSDFLDYLSGLAEEAGRRKLLAMRIHAQFLSRDGQLPLIPGAVAGVVAEPTKPRAKRRVMMHDRLAGSFECPKCHETEPIPEGTNDAARKRGVPCPKCNGPEADLAGEK